MYNEDDAASVQPQIHFALVYFGVVPEFSETVEAQEAHGGMFDLVLECGGDDSILIPKAKADLKHGHSIGIYYSADNATVRQLEDLLEGGREHDVARSEQIGRTVFSVNLAELLQAAQSEDAAPMWVLEGDQIFIFEEEDVEHIAENHKDVYDQLAYWLDELVARKEAHTLAHNSRGRRPRRRCRSSKSSITPNRSLFRS